jgi:membrane-associated phospholipid phosphatase
MARTTETGMTAALAERERSLLVAWRTLPHTRGGDRFAVSLSRFADHGLGWIAIGLLGASCDRRRAKRWLAAAATVAASEQGSRLVKGRVRRQRPQLLGLPPLASVTARYSFPSSHTATAVAAIYAFEGLLPYRGLLAWATLTAASRPYLGVHYPSDVAFGALLGAAAGRSARLLVKRLGV